MQQKDLPLPRNGSGASQMQPSLGPSLKSRFRRTANVVVPALAAMFLMVGLARLACGESPDQASRYVIEHDNRTIVIEPFGDNIVRVTMSTEKPAALAAPGYGIVGTPSMTGWTHEQDSAGYDVIRSGRWLIRVAPKSLAPPKPMPLDELNQSLRDRYFYGGWSRGTVQRLDLHRRPSGEPLLTMWRWSMVPNQSEGSAGGARSKLRRTPATTFPQRSTRRPDEHYYGLGQQQQGALDLRDHQIRCWHDYSAIGGENVCVPFMVSSRGYGLIWDNPSKTTIDLGFNQQNVWSSEIGDRVSFFVIAGDNSDEIYQGYRQLTGDHASCCRRRPMATSRARRSIPRRIRSWRLRKDIAIASFPWMFWWWTF